MAVYQSHFVTGLNETLHVYWWSLSPSARYLPLLPRLCIECPQPVDHNTHRPLAFPVAHLSTILG